jgi:hypothetical protein
MTAESALAGYPQFLDGRDGAPDVRRHVLAKREAFFAELDASPLRSRAAIDVAAYRRNLPRHRIEKGLDARVLWLLATAKANQAERFGVGLADLYGRVPAVDEDAVRVHLHLQELYHTRILADVVALFDLPVHPAPPALISRAIIYTIVFMPPGTVLPLVGFSEMAGCVVFRILRDRGVALFADEPAIAARVRLLYDEILADEISHVAYVTALLGPRGRRLMLWMYRRFAVRVVAQMPELVALFGVADLQRSVREFELEEIAADLPGKAFGAAQTAVALGLRGETEPRPHWKAVASHRPPD